MPAALAGKGEGAWFTVVKESAVAERVPAQKEQQSPICQVCACRTVDVKSNGRSGDRDVNRVDVLNRRGMSGTSNVDLIDDGESQAACRCVVDTGASRSSIDQRGSGDGREHLAATSKE